LAQALDNLRHNLELLATLPGPDKLVYLQGLAVAMKLTEIGYIVKHITLPAHREAVVDLTNPKLEASLIDKGLYKEVAYLESTGSIHITASKIEGEIPHSPPADQSFRESLFRAGCYHTAHVSPNAVHEHFSCTRNKLDLILNFAETAFKYGFKEVVFAVKPKTYVIKYFDAAGKTHVEEMTDTVSFYQRVRREGLTVVDVKVKG